MKNIAILTSGGDAPGMNACLEAATYCACRNKITVIGIEDGYEGLLTGKFRELETKDVWRIKNRGGSILGSGRSKEFTTEEGKKQAVARLKKEKINGLIVVGGDGSLRGAHELNELGIAVIGLPGTIDNDLSGTDYCIGFPTAISVVTNVLENIRNTAEASHIAYIIYTMGGAKSGQIALRGAIAGRADCLLVPENPLSDKRILEKIEIGLKRKHKSHIIVMAEAYVEKDLSKVEKLIKKMEKYSGIKKIRTQDVGYLQRGSDPVEQDIYNSLCMGFGAVKYLLAGEQDKMLGLVGNDYRLTPLTQVSYQGISQADMELAENLGLF